MKANERLVFRMIQIDGASGYAGTAHLPEQTQWRQSGPCRMDC